MNSSRAFRTHYSRKSKPELVDHAVLFAERFQLHERQVLGLTGQISQLQKELADTRRKLDALKQAAITVIGSL